jgi:hypothetical protein
MAFTIKQVLHDPFRGNVQTGALSFTNSSIWGQVPGEEFMKRLYIKCQEQESEYKTRSMMEIKGDILSGDHTFKVAKIVVSKGERLFKAQYTLMNENSLVIGYWFTTSKSLAEIQSNLKKVAERYGIDGGPKVFYTDLCCPEREILRTIFPSLQSSEYSSSGILKFKGEIIATHDPKIVAETVYEFMSEEYLGFDTEWECALLNAQEIRDRVCTLQLCSRNKCLIIQLYHLETIPDCLLDLLKSEETLKIGWNSKADTTRLKRDWNIDTLGVIDMYTPGRGTLQRQCAAALKLSLAKPYSIVISSWGDEKLTNGQIKYAATDAYACLLLRDQNLVNLDDTSETIDLLFGEDKADSVQKDVFHVIQQYHDVVLTKHPLYSRFLGLLSDAIFLKSSDDLIGVDRLDIKKLVKTGRIARIIPKPSIVASRLHAVVTFFRKLDSTFIDKRVMDEHRKVLQHVANGCISDVEGVVLHQKKADGTYFVARGNSKLEGYHLHNRSNQNTATIERGHYLSVDKNFRWNQHRKMDHGLINASYCMKPWILDDIKLLFEKNRYLIH